MSHVARLRTLTSQWACVPSIGQKLKPFIGNSHMSKTFSSGTKNPEKNQTSLKNFNFLHPDIYELCVKLEMRMEIRKKKLKMLNVYRQTKR